MLEIRCTTNAAVQSCARLQVPSRLTDKPYVAPTGSSAGAVALSPDLNQFLVEFSVALHKYGMYPAGHPALVPITARLTDRAEKLLAERAVIAFGIAQRQLIIDGIATDANHPILRRLAEELHRHHLGAISVLDGLASGEMASALRVLAEESGAESTPLGLRPAAQLPVWPHIRLHPLTFDRLQLVDEDPSATSRDGGDRGRVSHLWIGLASAAMAVEAGLGGDAEPGAVARAINEHGETAGYDQVIVGHLIQIAVELQRASGSDASVLRQRIAGLIAALQPETLKRLVTMGGNVAQRRAFIQGALSGMAVDSVIKILRATADASGRVVSEGLTRMLSKLAIHAEAGQPHIRPLADSALREQVDRLLAGWKLDDPNPEDYRRVLHHLATTGTVASGALAHARPEEREDPLRLVKMSLETGAVGPLVDRAIDRAIAIDARAVCQLLKSMPPASEAAAGTVKNRLGHPMAAEALVGREPLDAESLDEMLPFMSVRGYEVLVDALGTSNNRTTRRKLLDRLVQAELDIAPIIAARLDDERWYVQRNMLLVLQRLQRVPEGFSVRRWTRHRDRRVRHQAIRLQLTMPSEREAAIAAALEDGDDRITREGLLALHGDCPTSLAPFVARVAMNPQTVEELRVKAVRVLATSREPLALETLLKLVDGGKTVLGKPRLEPRTPLVEAALRGLSVAWASDPRSADMLALAGTATTPIIRRAARPLRA